MKPFYALGVIVAYVIFMNWITGETDLIRNRIRNVIQIFEYFKETAIKAADF